MPIVPRWTGLLAASILLASACGPKQSAPRFVMTVTPARFGLSPYGHCLGVDVTSSSGVWWWEPSEDCTRKTSGPSLMQATDARVRATGTSQFPLEITFRLGTHSAEKPFVDVHLTLEEDVLIDMTGARVKTQRRADLNIPDRWLAGR
jgi:hypothetical protein